MGTVDHYADRYWNDLPGVVAYLCRRSTGDPTLWWMDYVKATYATPPRRRALVIGCGNGWVMQALNAGLPERFRSPHALRPSLHAFLTGDPTEAVHSAEILRAVEDYFDLVERKDLGGGIAYQVLWNNIAEFEKNDPEAREVLSRLLEADEDFTRRGTVPSLFCFSVARARRSRPDPRAAVDRLLREPVREAFARASGMIYPMRSPARSGRSGPVDCR